MKKVIPIVVAGLVTISSFGSIDSYANPGKGHAYGHNKNNFHVPYGISKKVTFTDCDVVEWARKAIELMAQKGYLSGVGNGLFLPRNEVTKIEAIAMALRITGYSDEATKRTEEIVNGKRELSNKHLVSQWAYGYLDLALQRGIIKEDELRDFSNNRPAKRIDLVKYVIRALGLEDEADDYNDKDLDYKDENSIDKDLVGYVYLAKELNIMSGYPDETFQPNKSVTRAQMAVLMEKIDYLIDNDLINNFDKDKETTIKYTGLVKSINSDRLQIKVNNYVKTFYFNKDTEIEDENGDEISYKNINEGDKINIEVNKDNKVTEIELVEHQINENVKGILKQVNIKDDNAYIVIEDEDNDVTIYDIDEDVITWINENRSSIDKLRKDDKIIAELNDDDEIIYIDATRQKRSYEVRGKVRFIEDDDEIGITIGNKTKRYEIDDDVDIRFKDNVKAEIEDIKVGSYINLILEQDDDDEDEYEVRRIVLSRSVSIKDFSANFVELSDDEDFIQVKQDGKVKTYELDKNIKVEFRDGSEATLSDLDKDDFIYLSIDYEQEIVKIVLSKNERTATHKGILVEYTKNHDNNFMVIKDSSTHNLKVYSLNKNVEVYIDGDNEKLSDLDKDDVINYKVNSHNKIIEVRVID